MRTFLLHPAGDALDRFAHSESMPSERESVSAHLQHCSTCRSTIAFQRELRQSAQQLRAPAAPAAVLAQVLSDRADGARAILPTEMRDVKKRVSTLRAVGIFAAASVMALLLVEGLRQTTRDSGNENHSPANAKTASPDSAALLGEGFVSALFLPNMAHAATASRFNQIPPIAGLDGTRLHAMNISFQSRWVDSAGKVTIDGNGTTKLSAGNYQGISAWRIENLATSHAEEDGQLRSEAETLWVRHDDLKLLARSVRVAPYRRYSQLIVRQQFHDDSVSGDMYADGGVHRVFRRQLPDRFAPYTTDALAPLFLGAVQLNSKWRGSISLVGWGVVPNDVIFPSSLTVVGEERITINDTAYDCWKMRIVTAAGQRTYWVRKVDGIGVKVRLDAAQPKLGTREVVLANF